MTEALILTDSACELTRRETDPYQVTLAAQPEGKRTSTQRSQPAALPDLLAFAP